MKCIKLFLTTLLLSLLISSVSAGVDIGLSIDQDGVKGFYLAIGDHYGVAEKEIVIVRKQNVPDEELPVVFFIARHAEVKPTVLIKMRLSGKSWMDIALHFGLTAEHFYTPLKNPGPPYGKAWGHFKKKKQTEWKSIRLTDSEITASVNLNFISIHYGYSPDEVATMRSAGKYFVSINSEIKKKKHNPAKPIAKKKNINKKLNGKGKPKKK